MKSKFFVWLLVIVLCFGLTGCADTSPMSLVQAVTGSGTAEEDSDFQVEIPEAALHLSEEEEILLNGELKDGVYVNRYFGYRFTAPEGWTLVRCNDDATETTDVIPLRQGYEDGWGGLYFSADNEGTEGYISINIAALKDDEIGLSEEELVKKNIERTWEINRMFDEERGPEYGTCVLAGEEHPMSIQVAETGAGEMLYVGLYIPKGDFKYGIYYALPNTDLEPLLALFEKI